MKRFVLVLRRGGSGGAAPGRGGTAEGRADERGASGGERPLTGASAASGMRATE